MHQLLRILLTAIILICPCVCCLGVKASDEPSVHCPRCTMHGSSQSPMDKQAPTAPSPCKSGDCPYRGAVLTHPVEIQLDYSLPCAICSVTDLAALPAVQLQADVSERFHTAHPGAWSTGRELRLVIDSLLI